MGYSAARGFFTVVGVEEIPVLDENGDPKLDGDDRIITTERVDERQFKTGDPVPAEVVKALGGAKSPLLVSDGKK